MLALAQNLKLENEEDHEEILPNHHQVANSASIDIKQKTANILQSLQQELHLFTEKLQQSSLP